MPAALRLEGKKFNKWTVLTYTGKDNTGQRLWQAICDCGIEKIVNGHSVKTGLSKSCGCLQLESATTHGMKKTRFYSIWHGMKQRCLNTSSIHYFNYGHRGITVCDGWMKFEKFRDDIYESYLKHVEEFGEKDTTLDRIDVDGNYELSNCKWSTRAEQNRTMRTSSKTNDLITHIKNRKNFIGYMNIMLLTGKISTSLFEYRFGTSLGKFRKHIESKFLPGMTWDNHGNNIGKWEFDHIQECYKFDLSNEIDLLACFNYRNIRPMWFKENRVRSKISRSIDSGVLI